MSAHLMCSNCREPVAGLDPETLVVPGVGPVVAVLWIEHQRDCPMTCRWCFARLREPRLATCGAAECKAKHRAQRVSDRLADVETLLHRTADADWIARQVGMANAQTLRRWVRVHGRADLADGPLAYECGVAS